MNQHKMAIINSILVREGGFIDHPDDSGGPTNYGITQATARKYGFKGPIQDLNRTAAIEIYSDQYWPPALDQMVKLSPAIAAEFFDTSVNMGPKKAGVFLQDALNVLNRKETDYNDIAADGIVGSGTIAALGSFLSIRGSRGERALHKIMNGLQCHAYVQLAKKRKKDETHLFGWISHRIIFSGKGA